MMLCAPHCSDHRCGSRFEECRGHFGYRHDDVEAAPSADKVSIRTAGPRGPAECTSRLPMMILGWAEPSRAPSFTHFAWSGSPAQRLGKTCGAEDWQKGSSTVRRDLSHMMAVSSRSMHMATTFRTVWPESTIHSRDDDRPAIPCMDRVRTCDGAWPGAVCRSPARACTADPRPERLQWVSP